MGATGGRLAVIAMHEDHVVDQLLRDQPPGLPEHDAGARDDAGTDARRARPDARYTGADTGDDARHGAQRRARAGVPGRGVRGL